MEQKSDSGVCTGARYRSSGNYIHRKIAETDVLISVGANIADFNGYIQLNKTASALWERLQEPSSFEEMVQFLQETYDLSREHAAKDAEDFLKELQEHDMVVMC